MIENSLLEQLVLAIEEEVLIDVSTSDDPQDANEISATFDQKVTALCNIVEDQHETYYRYVLDAFLADRKQNAEDIVVSRHESNLDIQTLMDIGALK